VCYWSYFRGRTEAARRNFALALAYAFTLIVCCRFCLPQSSASRASLEELSSLAEAAQQRGDYSAAAKAYQALVERRPEIAELWANLGLMQEFLGNYAEADHALQVALRKKPGLYVPNLFLGLNRLRVHQPRAALGYLNAAVSLNARDEQAVLGLARAYSAISDDDNAARWFDKARQLAPQDAEAWYGLGISYLRLQNTAVLKLKALGPEDAHARTLVAESFLQQGRIKDAVKVLERLRSESAPPCLPSALGFAYAHARSEENAKQTFLSESASHPECLLAHIGLAQVAFANDQVSSGLEQLYFVMDRDADFLDRNLQRVWSGLDQERIDHILTEVEQNPGVRDGLVLRLQQSIEPTYHPGASSTPKRDGPPAQPQTAQLSPLELWSEGRYGACASRIARQAGQASAALSQILEACSFYAGQYHLTLETSDRILHSGQSADPLYWKAKSAQELAADAFAQMNTVAPDSPKAHLLMAELHRAREEFSAAESEYNRALASDSNNVSAHLGLAHIFFQSLEDDKATEQLQTVLKADPSNQDAHSLLGEVLVRRHKYADAIPHLKIALKGFGMDAPQIHSSLAQCYSVRGDYALALRELKLALPEDTTGAFYYQAYQLYQKMGDPESATAALRKAAEIRRRESDAEQQRTQANQP
jgi:tetratricopeptide (TPR) repeat protein